MTERCTFYKVRFDERYDMLTLIGMISFVESIRVLKFCDLCRSNGSISDLALLMRQSHLSLDIQYQCSHPKLNELVQISDSFGVGARLTGAG